MLSGYHIGQHKYKDFFPTGQKVLSDSAAALKLSPVGLLALIQKGTLVTLLLFS